MTPKKGDKDKSGRKPGSYEWYEIQDNIAYYEEFVQNKIVFNETSKELHAFIDNEGLYINKTGFIIVSDENEYILGILNSRLMDFYYRMTFPSWGDPWNRGRIQFRKDRMVKLPIATASEKVREAIEKKVREISEKKGIDPTANTTLLEREIDQLVYKLYGLTEEEIGIVEGTGDQERKS